MRTSRYAPKGKGWIRVLDYGDAVMWMKPSEGGVEVTVYSGNGFSYHDNGAQVWHLHCPSDSWFPWTLMDKIRRVTWTDRDMFEPGSPAVTWWTTKILPPSHKGHRRLNSKRRVWKYPLPNKILKALGEYPWR